MLDAHLVQDRLSVLLSATLNVDVPAADTDLFDAGVLDSLTFVELLLLLEREFGVATSADDLDTDTFRSIARIAAFVMRRKTDGCRDPQTHPAADLQRAVHHHVVQR